jgi:Tfp pilus assembly protein PilF
MNDPSLFDSRARRELDRSESREPRQAFASVVELRHGVARRAGSSGPLMMQVMAALADRARDAGEHAARADAFAWLARILDARGDAVQAIDAVLGLALAESDAGSPQAAEAHYRDALKRAEGQGPAAKSKVLRNWGLHLAAARRRDQAEEILEQAASEARLAGDADLLGRALLALGILVGRRDDRALAASHLEAGLRLIPATDPDAICARNHLAALSAR